MIVTDAFERVAIDPAERRAAIVDVIRGARRRLGLSIFRCDDEGVLEALVAARARGVGVEVLLTRRARRSRGMLQQLERFFERHGIVVHRSPRHRKYHAKFVVADERTAIVTSGNLTRACFSRTSDFVLLTRDPDVLAGLTWLFEADCHAIPAPVTICDRLIVSPDNARTGFTRLLAGARRSIRLIDPKLRDPRMHALLAARRLAGVDVRTLGSRTVGDRLSHGKLCVIDDEVAVIGSTALSAPALDLRRELSVRISRPATVRRLAAHFDDLFVRSMPVPPRRGSGASRAAGPVPAEVTA